MSIDHISSNIEDLTKSAQTMREYNRSAEQIMQELIAISEESGVAIENVRKQTDLTNQSAQQIRTATVDHCGNFKSDQPSGTQCEH